MRNPTDPFSCRQNDRKQNEKHRGFDGVQKAGLDTSLRIGFLDIRKRRTFSIEISKRIETYCINGWNDCFPNEVAKKPNDTYWMIRDFVKSLLVPFIDFCNDLQY